ncbi:MAG: 3-phosphoshikimate 1-carboxyvinyltransferase [Bacteroidetes bacterium]|nr:3-phosphoshikimate 1-carboxyvinyltransferase [Bacteroidota bacterium]
MTKIKYNKTDKSLIGKINLPSSKSITNRALILNFLSKKSFNVYNLSSADDSILLNNILNKLSPSTENNIIKEIFVDNAGTAMRFLTALLSVTKGNWLLTGSERMKERPVTGLVNALLDLGADINYTEKPGYPPLLIKGKNINNKSIEIESGISSQFISAILLIAPFLANNLTLTLKDKVVSKPYIIMTLNMLGYFGINFSYNENTILIKKQNFQPKDITIESDWSAASYWYLMAAFSDKVDLHLKGLYNNNWQGDSIITDIFRKFGVQTEYLKDGVRLYKTKETINSFVFDFTDYPDIAPTLAVCCAGLGIKAELNGLQNLTVKESNRLEALETELNKLGCNAKVIDNNTLKIESSLLKANMQINTYNDHRMAMSFAPLAILLNTLEIDDLHVVKKSYPGFWEDIEKIGFSINN